MLVHFFIGLILMTHPGRAIETLIVSQPFESYMKCEENIEMGLNAYSRNYEPLGWKIKDIYCVPISAEDSLNNTI
jgi:hypothetical protein